KTLRDELSARNTGVSASVLCPGRVSTSLRASSRENGPAQVISGEEGPPLDRTLPGELYRSVLTPAEVAEVALDGIERNQLYILTHADSVFEVRTRIDELLADIDLVASQ